MPPNMVFDIDDQYVLAAHSALPPAAEEWRTYVAACRHYIEQPDVPFPPVLIYTGGGTPNALQRKEVASVVGERPVRQAIITPSVVARGIVTAVSWFITGTRAFTPDQLEAALDHLQVPAADRSALLTRLDRLKDRLRP